MFSVVVSVFGNDRLRHEAFQAFLYCIEKQSNQNFELVIVEQVQGKPFYSKYLKVYGQATKYLSVKAPDDRFCFSWLKNIGARESRYDTILFIDADLLFKSDYFDKIAKRIESTFDYFIAWDKLYYLTKPDSRRFLKEKGFDFSDQYDDEFENCPPDKFRTGGAQCFNKKFYLSGIGASDEGFFGWGGEDDSLIWRASKESGAQNYMSYTLYHMNHGNRSGGRNTDRWLYTRRNADKVIIALKHLDCGLYSRPNYIDWEV